MNPFKRKKQIKANTYERRLNFEQAQALSKFIQREDGRLRVEGIEEYEYTDTYVIPPQSGKAFRIRVRWRTEDWGEDAQKAQGTIERPSQYVYTPHSWRM